MTTTTAPTVVLVHGAFADVIRELQVSGLSVRAPANPLRGPAFDGPPAGAVPRVQRLLRAGQLPRVLRVAMRTALERGGVAAVVDRPAGTGGRRPERHPGPAGVGVRTERREIALPPKVTFDQARGFTLWATRSALSGDASEVGDVAKVNLREPAAG
ncbi:hypothetical protein WIS52_06980 [Pseudonocardia nematodicida]|uniref:Uncharacterized protein n=1 Tax=Pseudonocardia nematodicida TaxID=1206997 RepID=A0ABV1K8M6_9PSEU